MRYKVLGVSNFIELYPRFSELYRYTPRITRFEPRAVQETGDAGLDNGPKKRHAACSMTPRRVAEPPYNLVIRGV